ncbi:hypothetical protein [Streptomyces sp. YIM 121038]|uniref:hypothetical protein n=1 Tax=Streptomyces sp. YIM 121038 TaxID=2136401 RepID=UPI0014864DBF|nr:hypothetical protein [Streptomyces sp. YIM 121038]
MLVDKGMVAFLTVAAALSPRVPRAPVPPTTPDAVCGLEPEVVRIWASMVLAHAP